MLGVTIHQNMEVLIVSFSSRGWLVSRLIGRGQDNIDAEYGGTDDTGTNGTAKFKRGGWGARGVSVSADEQLLATPDDSGSTEVYPDVMKNADVDAGNAFKDHGTDGLNRDFLANNGTNGNHNNGLSNGNEWQNNGV